MKKIFRICFTMLVVASLFGCSNTNVNNSKTEPQKTVEKTVKSDDGQYRKDMLNILSKLNERIAFDYKKALLDYDSEFLSFNIEDLNNAEKIYNQTSTDYNNVKNDNFKETNNKIEEILNKYSEMLKGRHLVVQHKGDEKFLSTGYSHYVVTPINTIKKLNDDLQSSLKKVVD